MKRALVTLSWWFIWRKALVPDNYRTLKRAWNEAPELIRINPTRCGPDLVMMILAQEYTGYSWRLWYWNHWQWYWTFYEWNMAEEFVPDLFDREHQSIP